jgi:hypothetical protein
MLKLFGTIESCTAVPFSLGGEHGQSPSFRLLQGTLFNQHWILSLWFVQEMVTLPTNIRGGLFIEAL